MVKEIVYEDTTPQMTVYKPEWFAERFSGKEIKFNLSVEKFGKKRGHILIHIGQERVACFRAGKRLIKAIEKLQV